MSDEYNNEQAGYGNVHRAFLQALLARTCLTLAEAKPLLAKIQTASTPNRPTLPEDISEEDLTSYIDIVNNLISPFDFEIRSTFHQVTKERIYAFVNTTSDAITQMATIHSAEEIAFVKRVLDAMFATHNTRRSEVMAITSMQALKLAKPGRRDSEGRTESSTRSQVSQTGLTMVAAETMLGSLVSEGWFELSKRGFYTLTPRALMELRGWLVDTYNGQSVEESDEEEEEVPHEKIKFCRACREIVTRGQRCPKMQCEARLHDHCVRTLWRAQSGSESCPACKTAWVNPPPVGEKAAKRNANDASERRRTIDSGGHDDNDDDG